MADSSSSAHPKIGVYAGSFDPITLGHADLVTRSLRFVDRLVVAVAINVSKEPLFSVDERLEFIRLTVGGDPRVEVRFFEGLLVDFVRELGATLIIRGLRAVSDFEYELQMAQMNRRIGGVETLFLSTSPEHSYLSSSLVKEVARLGGRLDGTVPPRVGDALRAKFGG